MEAIKQFSEKFLPIYFLLSFFIRTFASQKQNGGLAQLARALAWHARGHRFDSDILHKKREPTDSCRFLFLCIAEAAMTGLYIPLSRDVQRRDIGCKNKKAFFGTEESFLMAISKLSYWRKKVLVFFHVLFHFTLQSHVQCWRSSSTTSSQSCMVKVLSPIIIMVISTDSKVL